MQCIVWVQHQMRHSTGCQPLLQYIGQCPRYLQLLYIFIYRKYIKTYQLYRSNCFCAVAAPDFWSSHLKETYLFGPDKQDIQVHFTALMLLYAMVELEVYSVSLWTPLNVPTGMIDTLHRLTP